MIEITALTKTYQGQTPALSEVSMTIQSTGMFGLLGPNGAGKTTFMRILAGILTPTSGNVKVFGHDLGTAQGKQAAKALIGYLPQDLPLYPTLTAWEFLDYMARLKGVTSSQARKQQVGELLDLVRLTDVANRRLKTYSGGMKRRVGIAQAMLGNPRLVIVDEPTVGLDPEERVRFRNLLTAVSERCVVLLSTHVIEDIGYSCNDLAILQKGTVRFRGSPRTLIQGARGKVWSVLSRDEAPSQGTHIVSTLQLEQGIQYRVIGTPESRFKASPIEPSLEDSYMLLMNPALSA
jgi:ABC-type multidrug transport system ATPase subunit